MPVCGTRKKLMNESYESHPLHDFAASFRDLANDLVQESGRDLFTEPQKTLLTESTNQTLRNFFVNNSIDEASLTPKELDDHYQMMNEQFQNDTESILEYSAMAGYNPVMGMTFPMHKNILMNCIFDKGAIQKAVAVCPKFTITMETRLLITPDGKEIDLYKQQMDITEAINKTNPYVDVEVTLPEIGATDILSKMGAGEHDNLSIETFISAVKVEMKYASGDTKPDGSVASSEETVDEWVPVRLDFSPAYGEFDRSLMRSVDLTKTKVNNADKEDIINANMHKNRFNISSLKGIVKAVKIRARKDASNGLLRTCSTTWRADTDLVEIPNATPINVPISPEEVKDIAALYNVNQLTKIMSNIKDIMENYKDDSIRNELDESWAVLDPSQKRVDVFDFAPTDNYALDHVSYRDASFMDILDSHVTELLQVLNDPNMTVTIFGRPDLIRKIGPKEYTYSSPSSIGPVELEFNKTVVTNDKRVYQFMSSQKLKGSDNLIVILNPRNTSRIIYRIYDYQMYVGNEIRNSTYYTLPSVHAFERWKFKAYQPVQGRFKILNPSGFKKQPTVNA